MTSLTFYGGVNEIGGNTILFRGEKTSILLDFGMSFSQVGKYYEEFLKPRTNNFLGDCLCMGLLPRIDGLYRDDLVEAEGVSSIIPPGCSATDYWVCDVRSYKDCKECGEKTIDAVLITHAHLDHSQYITLVDKEIPIYSSAVTKELLCCVEEVGTGDLNSEFTNMKRVLSSETGSRGYFPGTSKLKKDNPTERKWEPFSGYEELKIGEFQSKRIQWIILFQDLQRI